MEKKKALITGGCGVIGSHIIDTLLKDDYEVITIDNLTTGKINNVEHNLANPAFHFVNDSILNETLIDELVKEVSIIFHLAASVGVKYICEDPLRGILVNVRGSEIVFGAAYKYWKRVVFTSTSEVYGRSDKIPFKEDSLRVLGPTNVDRWSYSTSKATDEHLAFAYARKGLPISIVRYFNSYGPRIDERGYGSVVAKFISQALKGAPITIHGDGKQTRCFTYIDDTVRGTLLAGSSEKAIGEAFNIGNMQETSIEELAKLIRTKIGAGSEITYIPYEDYYGESYEDTRRRVPDISKAKSLLEFEATISLSEGLDKTIEWAKKIYKK